MDIVETFSPPSPAEMAGRLARVQMQMEAEGLAAYVTVMPSNILWLTNFANFIHERPFILVVPASGAPRFVIPRLEVDHVLSRHVGALDLCAYREFPAPEGGRWQDRLADTLPAAGRVGVESMLPHAIAAEIGDHAVASDLVETLRQVKSSYELGRIAYGCRLKCEAHDRLLAEARAGFSQSEVNATIGREVFSKMVADNPSVNPYATSIMTLVQNADVSHDPHNFTDLDIRMKEGGPHVTVFNSVINGYGAEVERTFFINHVPEVAKAPFETMLQARRMVFEGLKPGVVLQDLDRAVIDFFEGQGYGDNVIHRAGHGMGVTAHEGPYIADGDDTVAQAGMVFSLEPGIYFPGLGGFRFSDTAVVTETGVKALTHGPETLEDLTL
ncbi:Xaa-Pro peptidase family protein [Labrenzia sp. OB1]|uniref:M24 family metallopeptidase n=1 Tax=Labrenzia sp. OB1 TaxID=1561204 RepID=UPI0008394496|nr:Xaa-Pro peptidase family protein [Labrenzia sp. OB1]